jgi:hypothetical protein
VQVYTGHRKITSHNRAQDETKEACWSLLYNRAE